MIAIQHEGFSLGSRNGGKCSVCGAGDTNEYGRRATVSSGIDIDFEGRFDICLDCAREFGKVVGMVDGADFQALMVEYDLFGARIVDLEQALFEKEDAIRLLSGELVGASKRGVYGTNALREVDVEPDFGGEA